MGKDSRGYRFGKADFGESQLCIKRFCVYSEFSFDAESKKITLGAEAKNYTSMAQQRQIFINNPDIASVAVGDFNLDKAGKVLFSVELIFNSSLLASQ